MMISLSNTIPYPHSLLSVVPKYPNPSFSLRLNYTRGITYSNSECSFPVGLLNGYWKRKAYPVADYEGLWEDPDDASDDSEYEDDSDENDEENDLDCESDWETNGNEKAAVSNVEDLSRKMYEEDLFRVEVEQMLRPEEKMILRQNEASNLEKLSTAKWKPLHSFALAGQIKYMDVLLEIGYNIDLVDKDGLSALHLAVIGKREAVISHLLRKGANPEAKDKDGATPLHYAAQVGALQTVKLLIKCKVDVNVGDNEGWTPLHVSMQTRNRNIAKVLLVNGADKTRRNKDGKTPLDLSLCYGKDFKSYELAKLMKQVSTAKYS